MKLNKVYCYCMAVLALLLFSATSVFADNSAEASVNQVYEIENMVFFSGELEVESVQTANRISVDVTRVKEGSGIAKLIAATYTDDEKFIGISAMDFNIEYGTTVGINMPVKTSSSEEGIGEIKVFIWDGFGTMRALALPAAAKMQTRYAIADILIENSGIYAGDRLRMFTAEGEAKTLVIDPDAVVTVDGVAYTSGQREAIWTRVGKTVDVRTPIQNRAVAYKISVFTGRIIELTFLNVDKTSSWETDEFDADSAKLGTIALSGDTKIIDAVEYSEKYTASVADANQIYLNAYSLEDLPDGAKYTAYAYNNENGACGFVIITAYKMIAYNEETRFAVVASSTSEDTDEAIYMVNVQNIDSSGNVATLSISGDAVYNGTTTAVGTSLKIGDVIAYTYGDDRLVNEVALLFDTATQGSTFTALADKVISNTATVSIPAENASPEWTTSWTETPVSGDAAIRLMVGIVAENNNNKEITLVVPDSEYQTNLNGTPATGVYKLAMTDDTAVYTYDYGKQLKNRVGTGLPSAIIASTIPDECYTDADKTIIDWSLEASRKNIKLAFVKTLGDTAVDVLYITGSYNPSESVIDFSGTDKVVNYKVSDATDTEIVSIVTEMPEQPDKNAEYTLMLDENGKIVSTEQN